MMLAPVGGVLPFGESCENHTTVSMLGTDFTYDVLLVERHRFPPCEMW